MKPPEKPIAGYVLAGGRSQRMGQDKALLQMNGTALAARVANVLQTAGCQPVYLVGRQPELHRLGWPVVSSEAPRHHPLNGIAAALRHAQNGHILVAACDLIHLETGAVHALLQHGKPCVAHDGNRLHPLLSVLSHTQLDQCLALLDAQLGAHRLVEKMDRIQLSPHHLHNANTPEQLAE